MRGLKAVLFDKDGTIVDFDRTWGPAAGVVIQTLAGDDPAAVARLQEVSQFLPAEQRFLPTSPIVAGSAAHYGPLWAQALGREATQDFFSLVDRLFAENGMRHLTPIGQPRDVFARLHGSGLDLAIVTNDAEANARQQVEVLGLLPYLKAVHGYDSGFGSKPDPGMVLALAEAFGHAPDAMAVVGDSPHDLEAARAAGARFILVRSGPASVDALCGAADLVVDSVDDLPALLMPSA